MSGFISRAACRGHRPMHLADDRRYQRPELIARLLKERHVARFLVAPFGYGKTSLASEYAATVFDYVHTFWVNGHSPCFIRDLDDGSILTACFEVDPRARLVVFDDVPALDSERVQSFSQLIDAFMARECEIVVTCSPQSDMYGALQRDRIRLGAYDLLLSDDELDIIRMADERDRTPSYQMGFASRIPALAWPSEGLSVVSFVSQSLRPEASSKLGLAMASAFVLGSGSLDDLQRVCPLTDEVVQEALEQYPHMGIDLDTRRFETPCFAVDQVMNGMRKARSALVETSAFETRDELALAWARVLVDTGAPARACDVVRLSCTRNERAQWVLEHALDIVRAGCFHELHELVESSRGVTSADRIGLHALAAVCLRLLGDVEGALKEARRCVFDELSTGDARLCGLVVMARHAVGADRKSALAMLEEELAAQQADLAYGGLFAVLARFAIVERQGIGAMSACWAELYAQGVRESALLIAAAWLFSSVARDGDDAAGSPVDFVPISQAGVETFVRDAISRADGRDFFVESAGLAMEHAHERGMPLADGALPTSALLWLRKSEMSSVMQRRRFEQSKRDEATRRKDWTTAHPDTLLPERARTSMEVPDRSVPVLSVTMFGRFEVFIGTTPVGAQFVRKKHLRSLLVLLVASQGRELSSEAIAKAMWPNRAYEDSRRNFYGVWSQLKHALSLPDGTCPYLIRHSMGCSLETRYVKSDMERFNEICRMLLFGEPDYHQWPVLYAEIERDFASDLLPIEKDNELVSKARDECRTHLIDALVSAAAKMASSSNPEWGIWFARAAIAHDDTREDAHYALMRSQLRAGQRTAAMASFMDCKRILAEKLGVDPSPDTMRLYEYLLNGGTGGDFA